MNKQIAIIYVLIASMILNVFVSNFDALAANVDNKCTLVTGVFARGSGQKVGQDRNETSRFRSQLLSRIGDESRLAVVWETLTAKA